LGKFKPCHAVEEQRALPYAHQAEDDLGTARLDCGHVDKGHAEMCEAVQRWGWSQLLRAGHGSSAAVPCKGS